MNQAAFRGLKVLPPSPGLPSNGLILNKTGEKLEARAGIEPAHKGFADLSYSNITILLSIK
jgi:hypothetical protein